MRQSRVLRGVGVAVCAALLISAAVAFSVAPAPAPRTWGGRPGVEELAALGRAMFSDPRLSADASLSCTSCHDPATAFGPNARTPNPFVDAEPSHAGTRAIPSLRYAQFALRFTEHTVDDEETHGVDGGPTGGLTWDGRADNAREQALIPLFSAHEMGNLDEASLARRVAGARYASEFRRAFSAPGHDVFDDPKQVVAWVALAFEVFEQGPEFAPFDSRYDRWLSGKDTLSPAEQRGLTLYRDASKGNCETCHPSRRTAAGGAPLFTDAGFIAVGAPRRAGLPVPVPTTSHGLASDARGADVDLGLCRSGRLGLTQDPSFCGRFRTPTLRNVATRTSFFHNGSVHSLREAVAFYVTRDTDPAHWYSRNADGSVHAYDDLPAAMVPFVDREAPFQPLPGGRQRLDDAEIDDLVAFLYTLTDADAQSAARR